MFDLLLRNARLADGTGAPARSGDVGILRGRIAAVGRVEGSARRVVDADGQVVAPGFIDVHTHYDAQAFWDTTLSPSPLHGITTVVNGNCGFSIAPLAPDAGDYLMRMLARVEGMPLESLAAGVPWDWTSTDEYLDRLDGTLAVNAGFLVGHSALRRVVMGDAANAREAKPEEIDRMRGLLGAGLAAGALGFSSSRGPLHNDGDSNPVPSRWANDDELLTLAAVCGDYPGTSLEYQPDRNDVQTNLRERMSAVARRPLNWNLLLPNARNVEECLERLALGNPHELPDAKVVGLVSPMPTRTRRTLFIGYGYDSLPGWAEVIRLPVADRIAVFRDPERRRELEAGAAQTGRFSSLVQWDHAVIDEVATPALKKYEGRRVAEIASDRRISSFDALLDIVCDDGLRTMFAIVADDTPHDWEARVRVLRDVRALAGGSDAGAHLDAIVTFGYATALLEHAVREQTVLPLEEAVRFLTADPADLYGLVDRGRLVEGAHADVVVFDPDTIGADPTETRRDLPAGAGRLFAGAHGISHVFVAGEEIVAGREMTDARPGVVLRSGRDTVTPSLT